MQGERFLCDILGVDKYYKLTGIPTYAIPAEPASYDPSINNATPTHKRKRNEEDWDLIRTVWFIRKSFLQGIVDNLRDALNEQYYSQLKLHLTSYRNITPFQILEHLNDRWCPLNVKAKKALKDTYYTKWDGDGKNQKNKKNNMEYNYYNHFYIFTWQIIPKNNNHE
jgi:hypothetical protein